MMILARSWVYDVGLGARIFLVEKSVSRCLYNVLRKVPASFHTTRSQPALQSSKVPSMELYGDRDS